MRALNADLPLRKTSVWGAYRAATVIPHRYGETLGELVQYDNQRRLFVWADHACAAVTDVFVDRRPVRDWRAYVGADSTGQAVTFVEFGQPVDEGAQPSAGGRGKLHARTGALIENPADLLWDLLANVAGRDVEESALAEFRVDAARRGLVVAGSIEEIRSAQSHAFEICQSVGAAWCPAMDGYARVYPGGALDAYVPITIDRSHTLQRPDAQPESVTNAIVIAFDWSLGEPRQVLELDAPDSIATLGRREATIDARWISSARVAHDVATRHLEYRARKQWILGASGIRRVLKVGQTIAIDHPASPYAGTEMIRQVTADVEGETCSVAFRAAVGAIPRTRLVRQSAQYAALSYAGLQLETQGGDRVLTLLAPDGTPLPNAQVLLDGQWQRVSDAGGRVVFPASLMQVGEHVIAVTDRDGNTYEFKVPVQ